MHHRSDAVRNRWHRLSKRGDLAVSAETFATIHRSQEGASKTGADLTADRDLLLLKSGTDLCIEDGSASSGSGRTRWSEAEDQSIIVSGRALCVVPRR